MCVQRGFRREEMTNFNSRSFKEYYLEKWKIQSVSFSVDSPLAHVSRASKIQYFMIIL